MPALLLPILVARMYRLPFRISFLFEVFVDEVRPTTCAGTATAAASGQAHMRLTRAE